MFFHQVKGMFEPTTKLEHTTIELATFEPTPGLKSEADEDTIDEETERVTNHEF